MTIQLRQGLGDNRNHWLRHAYHAGQRRSDVMLHGQDAVIVRVKIVSVFITTKHHENGTQIALSFDLFPC